MNTICASKAKWFTTEDGATDVEFIKAHEIVKSRGKIHAPMSSADILGKFRDRAEYLGLKFKNEKGALLKVNEKGLGGDRYMYTAEVVDDAHPDYALSVGFRNFGDKSLAFSGMCGNTIFVCENGVCTSIVKPSKMRHTIGNVTRNEGLLDSKIDHIFSRFLEDSDKIHDQIGMMKSTKLTDDIVGKFVRKIVNSPLWGGANIVRVLEDLENPAYNSHDDSSVFRLMNACSKVTSHDMKNPNQGMMASRFCNNLIMSIIDSNFTPLGDDVKDEVEDGVIVIA